MFVNLAQKLVFFSVIKPILFLFEYLEENDNHSENNSDMDLDSQKRIIAEFKFNKDVFAEVYNFYYEILFRFLLKRTMSSETAFDLLADTFEKAFKSFHKFKWQGFSIKFWLFRIAINNLKNYRRNLIKATSPLDNIPEGRENLYVDVKEELEELNNALFGDDELSALSDAIETLNPKYKEIISMYYFSDMSQREIAGVINKSESAVKASMHRAMENLRNILKTNNI
jgi:RNA polymerase sigma-70 factor, ECF subfamily